MKILPVCLAFAVVAVTLAQNEHVLTSDVKVLTQSKRVQGANPASMDLRGYFSTVKDEKKCRKFHELRQHSQMILRFSLFVRICSSSFA